MTRTIIAGAVLAVLAGLLAAGGDALGITTVWPVLLAAAVGLVAGRATIGRTVGVVLGAGLGFAAMALRAGFLPDTGVSQAIVVVLAIVVLTVVAAVSSGAVPLWSGLVGYGAFVGLYEPLYADNPTAFLAEAPPTLLVVVLATALGTLAAVLAELGGDQAGAGARDARTGVPATAEVA
ncbi:hypothetical protein FTX61_07870 [Nitriliruptoraceae bacterium ZYF776]|nr:hypothetical protein [Profundirhabdus halotolerans]